MVPLTPIATTCAGVCSPLGGVAGALPYQTSKVRGLLLMFYLELVSGLRKRELLALRWDDLDIWNKTISVSKQYIPNPDGSLELTRPKTENSVRHSFVRHFVSACESRCGS